MPDATPTPLTSSQHGIVLPSPSMQSQIHELAKTLPPPRRQNTACDACRSRKVKCHRLPNIDKCQHCLSKNYPCTNHIQQATSEKKRSTNPSSRRKLSQSNPTPPSPTAIRSPSNGSPTPPLVDTTPTTDTIPGPPIDHIPNPYPVSFHSPVTYESSTREVLAYLFSPPDPRNLPSFTQHPPVSPYAQWGDEAAKLQDEAFRAEFALDLVEVFFQIVHSRLPLLNPDQFRNSLRLHPSSTSEGRHLHPALVATVVAWGAKFSEAEILVQNRALNNGHSDFARVLVDRTRELAESLKVHRIPKDEHVVIGLLIEPLQSQTPDDQTGYHGFWLSSATRHLLDLGINHKSVSSRYHGTEERGTMIFAWWMACIADAYASLYYRHKPILDDDDYDIDFYTAAPVGNGTDGSPSPREQLEFLGYYEAAHSLASTARRMSRALWKPSTESDGVPFDVLQTFLTELQEWKAKYLQLVGVPTNGGDWDFVTAVSSCASDAQYHVIWIILFNAVDEVGIKELNENQRIGATHGATPGFGDIDDAMRKLAAEAVTSALRISALAGVLTSNGYLRLDPAVMHVSCIQAGTLLARLGRPEVKNCVDGLIQYSASYTEAGAHATEISRIFAHGNAEFTHLAAVAPRAGVGMEQVHGRQHHHGRMVEEEDVMMDSDN